MFCCSPSSAKQHTKILMGKGSSGWHNATLSTSTSWVGTVLPTSWARQRSLYPFTPTTSHGGPLSLTHLEAYFACKNLSNTVNPQSASHNGGSNSTRHLIWDIPSGEHELSSLLGRHPVQTYTPPPKQGRSHSSMISSCMVAFSDTWPDAPRHPQPLLCIPRPDHLQKALNTSQQKSKNK